MSRGRLLGRFALLLALVALLTGCWSRREINDVGVVTALGVDIARSGKLEVVMSVALPGAAGAGKGQEAGKGAKRVVILRQEGDTLTEAIRTAELASPRRLTFHHSRIILLGARLAEHGTDTLLDYLLRSPQVRLSARVYVLRGADPVTLLARPPLMEELQSESLREMEASRAGLALRLKDYFIARANQHRDPIIPVLSMRRHESKERGAPDLVPELSGAAIFRNDRVASYVDRRVVRGAMWLRATARDAVVTVPCPGYPGKHISATIARSRRKIRPFYQNGQVSFAVDLKSSSMRVTDVQCDLDLSDLKTFASVEKAMQANIAQRVSEVIQAAQKVQADPFDFGEALRVRMPDVWRQVGGERWHETWSKTKVTIIPNVRLVNVQMTTEPPSTRTSPGP